MYRSAVALPPALALVAGFVKMSMFYTKVFLCDGKVLSGELSYMWMGLSP